MEHRVALLGSSIALDCIGAALGNVKELALLRVERLPMDGLPWLKAFMPEAVIFDMGARRVDYLFDLLLQPGLLLVGLNARTHQMLLFSGQAARLATVEDLLAILTAREAEAPL
jgi:hypothetical protein